MIVQDNVMAKISTKHFLSGFIQTLKRWSFFNSTFSETANLRIESWQKHGRILN